MYQETDIRSLKAQEFEVSVSGNDQPLPLSCRAAYVQFPRGVPQDSGDWKEPRTQQQGGGGVVGARHLGRERGMHDSLSPAPGGRHLPPEQACFTRLYFLRLP